MEIKFRAWDNEHKKWLKINYLGCFEWGGQEYGIPAAMKHEIASGTTLVSPCQQSKGPDYFGAMSSTFFGKTIVLEQYTGVNDKNGKEIYKGDIYKDAKGIISKVEAAVDGWALFPISRKAAIRNLHWRNVYEGTRGEVIGNIHDNPELLATLPNLQEVEKELRK